MTHSVIYDIAAVGRVASDFLVDIDDGSLRLHGFVKSRSNVIDKEKADRFHASLDGYRHEPGGASANMAACISALGGRAVFVSKIAGDSFGQFLAKSFDDCGVQYTGPLFDAEEGTDRVYVLVTPDGERSFASYYGISHAITPGCLDKETIGKAAITHLEGYMLNTRHGYDVLQAAAETAKANNRRVSFCPNDTSIIEKYGNHVQALVEISDVLVMNEAEAQALSKENSTDRAIAWVRERCETGAVTLGHRGAMAFDNAGTYNQPAVPLSRGFINTNGAGDHFSGGFLYGLAKELSLPISARLGAQCSSECLTNHSARPQRSFEHLLEEIEKRAVA